jgi:hypothetical protein
MITKRNYIDLIQNRLNGGAAPKDVQKVYPRGVIARVLDMAFADVVINNSDAAADMSLEFSFTASTDTNGYYITLSPRPISGTLSIYDIYDDKNSYNIQDKVMARGIRDLRTNNKFGAVLFGNKLRLNTTPVGEVKVIYVPRVSEMADDDALYAGEVGDNGEVVLFTRVMTVLQGNAFQDELNNNAIDAQQQGR